MSSNQQNPTPPSSSSSSSSSSSRESRDRTPQNGKSSCKMKCTGAKQASTSSTGSTSRGTLQNIKSVSKIKSTGAKQSSTSSTGSTRGTPHNSQNIKSKSGPKSIGGKDGQKVVRSYPVKSSVKCQPDPKVAQAVAYGEDETVKQVSSPTCLTIKVKSNPSKPVSSSDKQEPGPQTDEDNIDSSLTLMKSTTEADSPNGKGSGSTNAAVRKNSSRFRYRQANIRELNPPPLKQDALPKVNEVEMQANRLGLQKQITKLLAEAYPVKSPQPEAAPEPKSRPKSRGGKQSEDNGKHSGFSKSNK